MNATATPEPGIDGSREWRGALNATAAMIPFVLVFGVIAFGAFGDRAAQVGLGASVLAVAVGGALLALWSRATLAAASPSASSCLILGSAVALWARDPALAGGAGLSGLLALVGATVFATGLIYVLLGLLRAGSLIGFVPRPVLSGFMNGVALLIMASQIPGLLGLAPDAWARQGLAALADWQPAALGVAASTALLAGALRVRYPRAPAMLVAMVLACAIAALLRAIWPLATEGDAWPLHNVGTLTPSGPTWMFDVVGQTGSLQALLARHAGTVLATALLLGLIGALESVLNLAAVEQGLRTRSDPNRLLFALGLTNLVLGCVGALPVVNLRLRAMAAAAMGARTRYSTLAGSVLIGLAFAFLGPLGDWIPRAVVAGVVVMLAWTLVDSWSMRLVRRGPGGDGAADRALSLGVMAAVCAVTLVWGFAPGVALGVLLSFVLLVRALNRSLIRSRLTGAERPSLRLHPASHQGRLAPLRGGIDIVELEGALFFGNVERLRRELGRSASQAPMRWALVLDLRRVSTIDASGAVALAALHDALEAEGAILLLAGVTADNRHGRVLLAHDENADTGAARWSMHADADRAIEAAERLALARTGGGLDGLAVRLRDSSLFNGLGDTDAARLAALMTVQELAAGERLFREGDRGDALYVLTRGSITMLDEAHQQRFVSFSPGHMFGEAAVLDGGGRTATAVADEASTVCRLSLDDLDRLRRDEAALAAQLHLNIARHLAERLRDAAAGWRRVAG